MYCIVLLFVNCGRLVIILSCDHSSRSVVLYDKSWLRSRSHWTLNPLAITPRKLYLYKLRSLPNIYMLNILTWTTPTTSLPTFPLYKQCDHADSPQLDSLSLLLVAITSTSSFIVFLCWLFWKLVLFLFCCWGVRGARQIPLLGEIVRAVCGITNRQN